MTGSDWSAEPVVTGSVVVVVEAFVVTVVIVEDL
jgi:hypothetical protein